MRNRAVLNLFGIIAPIYTYVASVFLPRRRAAVAAAECRNKCRIMALVQNRESYLDAEGKTPLQQVVERCYAQGPFAALWAVEGAGKDLAEWHLARDPDPSRLLIDARLDAQWDGAWLMLHAGMGLGFAKHLMEGLPAHPAPADISRLVRRTVDLCRANSRPGYYGAAIESLGLVARFMRGPEFCRKVHEGLVEYAPDSVGFFWRGRGRSIYFHPGNFLPGSTEPCRAIQMARREAVSESSLQDLYSGIAWPLTIVNMTDPRVMEWVLAEWDREFVDSPGFLHGVMSSVVMRQDTTPDYSLPRQFAAHHPDRWLEELWNNKIRQPIGLALDAFYPVLKRARKLDEVFHFQALNSLVEKLA